MKLSKLITYKHMVDGLSVKHVSDELFGLLKEVNTNLDIEQFDFDSIKDDISTESKNIKDSLEVIEAKLTEFKHKLSEFLTSVEEPYFTNSHSIYQTHLEDDAEYILDQYRFKNLIYDSHTRTFFNERSKLYTSWKWPAVEIRPALGEFTNNLLDCDPLYLVDLNADFFSEIKNSFTAEYQRRLRYYTVDETDKSPLNVLPQNQIGFITSVNFFNFRPIEIIEKYIASMFSTLCPGGVAMFTYNNCDHPIGVDNYESNYYCYTPGNIVKQICKKYGFKIIASFDMENNVSWLEIQKPGNNTSLRGGQNLARIENLSK